MYIKNKLYNTLNITEQFSLVPVFNEWMIKHFYQFYGWVYVKINKVYLPSKFLIYPGRVHLADPCSLA